MQLKKLFYKAFVGGKWQIAYRELHAEEKEQFEFAEAELPNGQWVADPFLIEVEGKHYLFCEQYETKLNRAGIGYFVFEDGVPVNKGIVIRRPYHMSYPCVFSYGDEIYMIPETSGNHTIEMYRAVRFPQKWELDTVLLENVQYVDSTVYDSGNGFYLLSYQKRGNGWATDVFRLDMQSKKLSKVTEKLYEANVARPAGSLMHTEGGLKRPAQDCSEKYGEALLIYAVDKLDDCGLEEHCEEKLTVAQFGLPRKVHRIHTLNRNSRYEVVDVFREEIDLLHGWKIFKRVFLKK